MAQSLWMNEPHKNCQLVAIFAENVKRLRSASGISQEGLADKAGVHRTYIGMLERREKNVTIHTIERIAKALEVEAYLLLKEFSI